MRKITRRDFVKAAAAAGTTAAIGRSTISRYVVGGWKGSKEFSLTDQFDLIETALAEGVGRGVTIVSDVDGHYSQCKMIVSLEEGKVIEIRGDPTDPEGKGELTMRGKHMRSMLYAPDRLKYPMFFGLTGLIAGHGNLFGFKTSEKKWQLLEMKYRKILISIV